MKPKPYHSKLRTEAGKEAERQRRLARGRALIRLSREQELYYTICREHHYARMEHDTPANRRNAQGWARTSVAKAYPERMAVLLAEERLAPPRPKHPRTT